MSDAADKRIHDLEQELRVAQELLALVLEEVGETVVVDIASAQERSKTDRMIDLQLDKENGKWLLSMVDAK